MPDKKIYRIKAGLIWLSIFLLFYFPTSAQIERDDEGPIPDSLKQLAPAPEALVDTLIMTYFTFDDIRARNPFGDSILHNRFTQYNPLYEKKIPYLNLGNLGSSAIPLSQFVPRNTGLDLGFHQYDVYKMNLDSFRWNRTNIPFTDLFFAAGKDNPEFRVQSRFSKNFPNGLTFNLDYERIIEEGYYQNQATNQTSLIAGLWHQSQNKKSNTFLTFLSNRHEEENNGGIDNESLFDDPNNEIRIIMPVILSQSETRHQQYQFSFKNYYSLFSQKDSLRKQLYPEFDLVSQVKYENGFLKFYDEGSSEEEDTLYYGSLLVDELGLRSYTSYHKFSLNPEIRSHFKEDLRFDAGFEYDYWRINQESNEISNLHDIKLKTQLKALLLNKLRFQINGAYHMGSFLGDFQLNSGLKYTLSGYFDVFVNQLIQRSRPSLLQKQLWVSGQMIYNNEFNPSILSETKAGISIPTLGLSLTASFRSINNYIYFDPELLFVQYDKNYLLYGLQLSENLQFKSFHFDNTIHLFQSNAPFRDLPFFYLISKWYFHSPVWKNRLLLDTGFEFYLSDASFVPSYQALTGSFYYQDEFQSKIFPLLNYYLSFKVSSFRFYVRTENILSLLTNDIHYQSKLYPQNDFKAIRLGVRWQFLN